MASHHHHHHQHHHATTCCSSCCNSCSGQSPPQPPPPPQQSDHLVQALSSLLLQTQIPQSQPNHCLNQNQTHFLETFQDQSFTSKRHHFHPKQHLQEEPNFLLSSLVSRINALESSLQHFSRTSNLYSYPSFSLKDAAARVIQTHFRAFLVHRSRTLRQLKDLAFIKSSLNSLKLSISNKNHFDYEAVSQKAMDLLRKLDSFQGGDPLVRNGKRSVSRDLVQFLEHVDGLALKRHRLLYKNAINVRVLGNGGKARILRSNSGEIVENLRERVEKLERISSNEEGDGDVELEGFRQAIGEEENPRISITGKAGAGLAQNRNAGVLVKRQGSQPRVKKTVSFAENGNVYRIISSGDGDGSSGDGSLTDETVSSDDHGEIRDNLIRESGGLVDIDEVNLDKEESSRSSSGEKNTRRTLTRQARSEIDGDYLIEDEDFVFSAPLPVKMETKADLMKKRKGALKIVS